jgi:site-specific DNA-methyltransferase (adenine-specific)
MTNFLYYGDNLQILRENITDESVDLVYLDPPFNSKRDYNVIFRSPKGQGSEAQITAFEDTWHWGEQAEREFHELIHQANTNVSEMIQAFRSFLGENDMMAYLTMMANRLLELQRVLKTTGSIYLHCDPTASHYLKIVLDTVFGPEQFRNEIVWKRTGSHNSSKRFGPIHDILLFYSKANGYYFRRSYRPYLQGHVDSYFKHTDERGSYWTNALTGAGTRNGQSGQPWKGYDPTGVGRHWAIPSKVFDELGLDENLSVQEKLDALDESGFIDHPSEFSGAMPTYRQYLEQSPGMPIQDIWAYQPHTQGTLYGTEECIDEDIRWLVAQGDSERLGYPTQKPLGLLERIISSSCPADGIVLDPFCGCGTAVHAAERVQRKWIGIDITHLAIALVEKRLKDAFPGIMFEVHGTPKDFGSARDLAHRDKYQFQWWVCSLINAQPYQGKKKGADTGIDGLIFFQDDQSAIYAHKSLPKKIIVSVKGGENVGVPMIRDLGHVVDREKAEIGLFVTLTEPTRPMKEEAVKAGYYSSPTGADFPKIQILTIKGLLDGSEQPRYPDLMRGGLMFKKAKKEVKEKQIALPSAPRPVKAAQPRLPGRAFSDSPLLDVFEEDGSED